MTNESHSCHFHDYDVGVIKLKYLPIAFKAWRILLFFRLSLWVWSFEKVKIMSQKMSKPNDSAYHFKTIIGVVNRVKSFVPKATCLSRALTAKVLLAQNGHSVELCIGIHKNQNDHIVAHAWLEKDGVVVMNHLDNLSSFVKVSS